MSDEIERLIPRLRRFARASTADREIADECVARAIEQLMRETKTSAASDWLSDQVRIYRAVERVLEADSDGSFEKQAWRALILVFVEEFSIDEAGRILGVDRNKVRSMVAVAEKQVKNALSQDHR
ncbi:MAG: hypothetical protein AAFW60_07220 [Pseudomonadota bacterium]